MKSLIASLCIFVLVSTGVLAGATTRERDAEVAWEVACTLQEKYTCVDVPVPTVVYFPDDGIYRGYYRGEDIIYINDSLRPGIDRRTTLVHETIHYLQIVDRKRQIPGWSVEHSTFKLRCDDEYEAISFVNEWVHRIGYPQYARTNWLNSYPMCIKFAPFE